MSVSLDTNSICQIVSFLLIVVIIAWFLQKIFNPKKNAIGRKYLEMESNTENNSGKESSVKITDEEKKFYEEIWNADKSERKRSD